MSSTRTGFARSALRLLRQLIRRSHGQDLIEYALLIGIVSIGVLAVIGPISQTVFELYDTTATSLPSAGPDPGGNGNGRGNGGRGNGSPGNGGPGNSGRGNPGGGGSGNGN